MTQNPIIEILEEAEVDYEIRVGSKHDLVFVNKKLVSTLSRRPKGGRHMANSIAMVKRFLKREGLIR